MDPKSSVTASKGVTFLQDPDHVRANAYSQIVPWEICIILDPFSSLLILHADFSLVWWGFLLFFFFLKILFLTNVYTQGGA